MPDLPFVIVKQYIDGIDKSLIISFEAYDEKSQQKLKQLYDRSIDKLRFYKAVRYKEELIFKVERFSINYEYDSIVFHSPHGYLAMPIDEEVLNILIENRIYNAYVKCKLSKVISKRSNPIVLINDVEIYIADSDKDTAKELLNDYNPLDLICYALGYKPTNEVKGLTIPRIIPQFKPYGASNVISFTSPSTGKTETAKNLSELTPSYYATSFPSRAKLIGDARFNSYGLCHNFKTIYIEEFDKLYGDRAKEFQENYEILLTGMEQGIWQREKSSKTDISYKNTVSLCFMGNVSDRQLTDYSLENFECKHRKILSSILSENLRVNIKPFMERITYSEYLVIDYAIQRDLNIDESTNEVAYLNPIISRGIFEILMEDVLKIAKSKREEDRYDRHFNTLKAILKVLKIDNIDDYTIEKLVYGDMTFWDVFMSLNNSDIEYVKVKALQDVPEFLGIDGKVYKLTKDLIIEIPKLNADPLLKHKVIEIL